MPHPTEIKYLREAREFEITFDDGEQFALSAEYLRVYSPSAEVRGHTPSQAVLQVGKEQVEIAAIEPVGNYAVRLVFSDGHNSGIYSFEELYRLGKDQASLWQEYLSELETAGLRRKGVIT